jgi:hypothetical protein
MHESEHLVVGRAALAMYFIHVHASVDTELLGS